METDDTPESSEADDSTASQDPDQTELNPEASAEGASAEDATDSTAATSAEQTEEEGAGEQTVSPEKEEETGPVAIDVTDQSAHMVHHLPLFDLYCSNLSKHVADALDSYIRKRPEIAVKEPSFKTFEPIGDVPGQPVFDRIYSAAKPQGLVGIVVPRVLVYNLVDILFGGTGEAESEVGDRELSPTENKMIDVLANALLSGFQGLLRNGMTTETVPELDLASIQQVAKHVKSEPMACIPLNIELQNHSQAIELWCSLSLLELVLGVSLLPRSDGRTVDPGWSTLFKEQVMDCPLDLKCTLAEVSMPLSRIAQMKQGDFIALSEISEATFSMKSLALFKAKVGVVNEKASASFVEWL